MKIRTERFVFFVCSVFAFSMGACALDGVESESIPSNAFLEPSVGKDDSQFLTRRGKEVEIYLEADVEAPADKIFEAPAALAQYAFSALKRSPDDPVVAGQGFYIMALAENLIHADNVEWLVDGEWISTSEARHIDLSKLKRFRALDVNAAVFNETADWVREGDEHEVYVPIRPFSIYQDVGDVCATWYPGIALSQSVYWFLWTPDWACRRQEDSVQRMLIRVTKIIERPEVRYPEYDRLWEDDVLDVAVIFGKLDKGYNIEEDGNWKYADQFIENLTTSCEGQPHCLAGFRECGTDGCAQNEICEKWCESGYLGRRFVRGLAQGGVARIDVFHPHLFHSVADSARFHNWQRAVSEHEVVIYNGHSVLGDGIAYEQVEYPDFYQIFMVFSCLSYSYYAHPIFEGKGGWENVDVIANADLGKVYEIRPMTEHLIRGLMTGFNNGGHTSWQDIMNNIGRDCPHSFPCMSGVSGNCFSPHGNLCREDDDDDNDDHIEILHLANEETALIEDFETTTSNITLREDMDIRKMELDLDLVHSFVGDLRITLSSRGIEYVVWEREGGASENIQKTFEIPADFVGAFNAGDEFVLAIADEAAGDTGYLNKWGLKIYQ